MMRISRRGPTTPSLSLLSSSIWLILTLLSCPLNQADDMVPRREALEIVIGGGGGGIGFGPIGAPNYETAPPPPPEIECPPPPPPKPKPLLTQPPKPKPPPSPPQISPRVLKIFPVVQNFKSRLEYGPPDVLNTWHGKNVCSYSGFTCDDYPDEKKQKAVSGVDFNGFGFRGKGGKLELTDFLDKLEDIVFFHANSNNFTGAIPDINVNDKIRFFYEIDLSNNKLTGTFPREVLRATNLTFVDLRFNGYCGTVPPEVFTLDVQVIFINNNAFSGKIPDSLGRTPALYLTFANNNFTGAIPKSIGNASETLIEVLFLNNQLSECLPHEVGNLKKMTLFDASGNYITGPIPQSFACLRSIELLNLARNRLFGTVPESLCELGASGSLQNLTLSENYFTQVGPKCRALIKKKYLDVDKNCIVDLPNQRPKKDCESFFLKKLRCPDEKWLNYIPCQNRWYSDDDEPSHDRHLSDLPEYSSSSSSSSGDGPARVSFRSSVTYGALTPRGGRQ